MMNYGLGNAMMGGSQRDGAPQGLMPQQGGGLFGGMGMPGGGIGAMGPQNNDFLAQAMMTQQPKAVEPPKQRRMSPLDMLFNPPLLSLLGIDLGRVFGIDKTKSPIER